jgi:catechol 2,3-dioxygenase-like lactoylglutathione lyase family enzyme
MTMLADHPIDVMLLATDLDEARRFYGDTLGLEVVLSEPDQFVTFACGDGTRLAVSKSTTGPGTDATQANWRVRDITAEVADLRARGVTIGDPIDAGFALVAFFTDPAGNSLGLLQLTGRP